MNIYIVLEKESAGLVTPYKWMPVNQLNMALQFYFNWTMTFAAEVEKRSD
jgi:hypothetical protein